MRNFTHKVNDTAPLATGILTAEEDNVRNEELENAVTAGGLTLDGASGPDTATNMLAQSMTRHASGALWCTESGSANAYVAAMAGDFVPPAALFEGLTVRFKPGNANTDTSTLNAFSLGIKAIVDHLQAPLTSGAMDGRVVELIYRPSIGSGSWQLPAWSNAHYVGQTPSSPPSISSGEGWSVDGSNLGNLNFGGLTSATPDTADLFCFLQGGTHKTAALSALAALFGGGGGLTGVQLLTASGTYTRTANTTRALVFATGGGGGGAGEVDDGDHDEDPGGGGGAGATAIAWVTLPGDTVSVSIGAGGSGGSKTTGSNGGSTSFGSYAVAGGGKGGGQNDSEAGDRGTFGGNGGTATTGLMLLHGSAGGNTDRSADRGGHGGASFWGGGRATGQSGGAYGAGGGGNEPNGAAGKQGCILVLEFA